MKLSNAYIHTCIHTYIYTYIHTYIQITDVFAAVDEVVKRCGKEAICALYDVPIDFRDTRQLLRSVAEVSMCMYCMCVCMCMGFWPCTYVICVSVCVYACAYACVWGSGHVSM